MKYEQPYGITDPNAPYINGNPAAGIQGSIPPAAAFEFPMRELVAMIAAGGQTPSDSDLQQLLRATRSQLINYCVDQGTLANNYTTAFNPPLLAYTNGMPFRLRVANTNTGASSFDAGPGRHPVKRYGGADPGAGDISAGSIAELVWNTDHFELMNFGGAGGGTGPPPVTVSGLINVRVLTTSGSYVPTTGATKAIVFATAGGGSGGLECYQAGGGGAGGTAIALVNLTGVPSVAFTIGAGGASVSVGQGVTAGAPGGATSFGSFAAAQGGLGGTVLDPNTGGGGAGGVGTVGLMLITGGDGTTGASNTQGDGGASFWGGGGAGFTLGVNGNPGRAYGAGGGGATSSQHSSGGGMAGVILILEF
jgi:hypothetical protein